MKVEESGRWNYQLLIVRRSSSIMELSSGSPNSGIGT